MTIRNYKMQSARKRRGREKSESICQFDRRGCLSLQSKSKCQLEGRRSSDSATGASQSPAHETALTSLRPPTTIDTVLMSAVHAFCMSNFMDFKSSAESLRQLLVNRQWSYYRPVPLPLRLWSMDRTRRWRQTPGSVPYEVPTPNYEDSLAGPYTEHRSCVTHRPLPSIGPHHASPERCLWTHR